MPRWGAAVRLALWNLGGAVPWDTDKSTLSHPGEYAFCIAEEEEDNPWPPLHVERGCAPGSDAVTVFACEGPHSVFCYGTPEEMLHVLTDSMCSLGNNNMHVMGQTLVTLNPLNAEEFAKRGWTKQDVRHYLWEHARRPLADVRACGVVHEQFRKMERDAGRYPCATTSTIRPRGCRSRPRPRTSTSWWRAAGATSPRSCRAGAASAASRSRARSGGPAPLGEH